MDTAPNPTAVAVAAAVPMPAGVRLGNWSLHAGEQAEAADEAARGLDERAAVEVTKEGQHCSGISLIPEPDIRGSDLIPI